MNTGEVIETVKFLFENEFRRYINNTIKDAHMKWASLG
jgi:hypothetical protein